MGDTLAASTEMAEPRIVSDSMPGSWVPFPSTSRIEDKTLSCLSTNGCLVGQYNIVGPHYMHTCALFPLEYLSARIAQQSRYYGLVAAGQFSSETSFSPDSGLQSTNKPAMVLISSGAFGPCSKHTSSTREPLCFIQAVSQARTHSDMCFQIAPNVDHQVWHRISLIPVPTNDDLE